jgi:putative heme iron utilization protein
MNADHSEAVERYARRLLGRSGEGWRMTGIDPEGLDMRRQTDAGRETARLYFAAPALTPQAARRTLAALAEQARRQPGPP